MVSAVVLTRNEEENLGGCLEKLKWCDDVLVIDDFSSDKTVDVAAEFGARVISRNLDSDFSQQRNFALDEIKTKWVLYVDADEMVSYDLRQEILKSVTDISFKAFEIKRVDYFNGKRMRHGEVGDVWVNRLVRRGSGRWEGRVHERWVSDGKVGRLKNTLKHLPHQTIVSFLRHVNFYSTIRALELYETGKKAGVLEIISFPLGKFFLNWVLRLGFLDGTEGTIYALMMSFHSFLVRAKLFLLWKNISGTPLPS